MKRCHWVNNKNQNYIDYHDNEWGKVSKDDDYLFEILLLETFQSGLSWECILSKREEFRKSYDNFDYKKIMNYNSLKEEKLMNNPGIVRNKLKIKASINNAKVFNEIVKNYGSFSNYIWGFTDGLVIIGDGEVHTSSPLSDEISSSLKKLGMKFVGTTTIYSYMQAIGMINDHEKECKYYKK